MAIIACPNCAKRISSRAKTCEHCGFDLHSVEAEDRQKSTRKHLRKVKTRLTAIAFLSILVFTIGILMTYYYLAEPGSAPLIIGNGLLIIGFVAFGVVRIFLAINKKQIKANR